MTQLVANTDFIARNVACSLTSGIPYSLMGGTLRVISYIAVNTLFGTAVGGLVGKMGSRFSTDAFEVGATVGGTLAWTQAVWNAFSLDCPS